ncbi:uncharacterized protein DUF3108 [Mucilaginibacter frigoritolerans]|jgi:hypothetical protein|uniref:Uncharacterized protein DUF3108 n=1 Tax=Mucilaginibacter frigoritolerans TaxID=652788 RepID=A0A562U2Y2_9SPHI|nr:DUF3108 domain-containing protein [Mucilaginibacter frigoritolerans]TWI99868.1 uncharacterized protein DUF3108 [Mucilaginibacter frigoritolerans]
MRKYFLIIVVIIAFFNGSYAQELNSINEPVFKTGEQLTYTLKYGFFTAAEAVINVEESDKKFDGHPVFHIVADGRTAGTFDIFYKVRNRYESYVDQSTLMPYFYTENRHEANYKHTDNVTFNHENDKITAAKGVFPYKGKVFDFLSAYYFSRSIDVSKIQKGEKFELQYFLEDGVHTLGITYVGVEKVNCSMGSFNCLKFNPTIIPGRVFRKDSKLYLWITDDKNRIPVKAHVELVVGSVTMDLTGAKNLKYPLNPLKK